MIDFILWFITDHTLLALAAIGVLYGVILITIVTWLAFGKNDDNEL